MPARRFRIRSRTRFIPERRCRRIRARYQALLPACAGNSDSGNDNVYVVGDALNGGQWGYNNLQWYGITYYHKFNDQWHISFEIVQLA